jgi:hypothetical protein
MDNSGSKKGYQARTIIARDEKGDLNMDSDSTFTRLRSHFSQLLNVHGVNDVRQTGIHTTESLVPELSALEMAVEKIKRHKSPGTDQILAELIKAGVEQFALKSINLLILSGQEGIV